MDPGQQRFWPFSGVMVKWVVTFGVSDIIHMTALPFQCSHPYLATTYRTLPDPSSWTCPYECSNFSIYFLAFGRDDYSGSTEHTSIPHTPSCSSIFRCWHGLKHAAVCAGQPFKVFSRTWDKRTSLAVQRLISVVSTSVLSSTSIIKTCSVISLLGTLSGTGNLLSTSAFTWCLPSLYTMFYP